MIKIHIFDKFLLKRAKKYAHKINQIDKLLNKYDIRGASSDTKNLINEIDKILD